MKSLTIDALPPALEHLKPSEHWIRDLHDADLWHGPNGLIVNSAALAERAFYFRVERSRPLPRGAEGQGEPRPLAG